MGDASSEILELVGQLHEGVVDEHVWGQGLQHICTALRVPALLIGAVSEGGRKVRFEYGHNATDDMLSLLEGPLADPSHNPWLNLATSQPIRRATTEDKMGGREILESSKIWSEFYVPLDLGDTIGATLERQPEYAHILVTGRFSKQPAFNPADLKFANAILPHLARAWRVKSALAEMETLAGTLRFVLDRLERAIVVAGPDGKVRFANRAADRLLSGGKGIDARQGRIRAARPRQTDALLAMIDGAARTGVGSASVAVDALSIPHEEDGPPLAIVAEPLAPAHSERLGHATDPGAILFISDSTAANRPSPGRVQIVYDLTPAEARLTSLIVQGQDIAGAAAALGISPNTAKYHLKTVFEKVGVSRQTQLVRRVLADVGGLAEPEKLRPSQSADSSPPIGGLALRPVGGGG
jgi:DNA-binding CsgD family transcriptional regulator